MRRLALLCLLTACATPPPPPPPPARDMKEELRRHGEWILVAPYGKLWHPNLPEVGKDFQPYVTGGQWVPTPRGWTFEGRWPWSDVVFHHGRWMWTNDYDWIWWFDEKESLAFVDWKSGSEFIGWSPLPPPAPKANMPEPERRWFFVKARSFPQEEIGKYVLTGEDATKASNLTEPVPPGPFNGPGMRFVVSQGGLVEEADGGYRVPEVAVPVPVAEPTPQQEAPRSNVEVDVVKPPKSEKPAKKTKKGKKK